MMAKMIMKGPDENRAIIRLEEKRGEKWCVLNADVKTKVKLNYLYAILWRDQIFVFCGLVFQILKVHDFHLEILALLFSHPFF